MLQSADEREFAELLLEWGLLSRQELDEAVALHADASAHGIAPPSFTETLIKYGFLTPRQVAEARSADTKGVFMCAPCGVGFEVRLSASRRNYQCPRCQGPLERQSGAVPSADLVSDTVPVDVQVAMHYPESKFGKYVLLGEVGRGGAAVIKKAWDTEERCYVALKFLRVPEGGALEQEKVLQLIQEGERAVQLRHPNIIRMHEMGCVSGQYYLAMEYLEGFTLADLIRSARARSKVSPFYEDPTRYLTMLRDVARAVHYAHSRKPPLIHCDLKPANVFVELSWRPYVLDFGVAHELNPEAASRDAGTLKGSPAYMAPEQALARPDEIDVRTDVYGLGAILYDLLTGRPPFTGELQEVLDKNLLVPPPRPSDVLDTRSAISGGTARQYRVPPEVEAICMKCLEKEKRDRYATAAEVADAIRHVVRARPVTQTQQPGTARRVVAEEKAPALVGAPLREMRRFLTRGRLKLFLATAAISVALAAGGTYAYLKWTHAGPDGRSPQEELEARMDLLAAMLQVEAAEGGYREYEEKHIDKATQAWVQARLDELEMVREMRMALASHLTRSVPALSPLKLRGRAVREAKILRATETAVELQSGGERQSISWSEIHPEQVFVLAWRDGSMTPRARMGLALFTFKNKLWIETRQALQRLQGTPLDAQAKALEKRLPPGE